MKYDKCVSWVSYNLALPLQPRQQGSNVEDKVRLEPFPIECQQVIETTNLSYLKKIGNNVNSSNTSQKPYWKINNKVTNKCLQYHLSFNTILFINMTLFPWYETKKTPLLVNNLFILNCGENVKPFSEFFSQTQASILVYYPHTNFSHG